MKFLLRQLLDAYHAGRQLAFTAVVETRGSTPQKAGAAMLVFEDGSQVGTLGGGCVEAEVKRAALECLQTGRSGIRSFQLDHDYGWDDGLICGGRMTSLIEPINSHALSTYYQTYLDLLNCGRGCTEAIVLSSGSEDDTPPRCLFDGEGQLAAQVGSRMHCKEAQAALRPLAARPRPYVTQGVAYLPYPRTCRLIIVGAGHVGRQLAAYTKDVDFEVWVVDDREVYCNPRQVPQADRHIVGPLDQVLPELDIDSNTFCVVVTRGHNHDEEALLHLIRRGPGYLGMIGSRRKIRLIFEDLQREGISPELLAQVHAPIGLEIGSRTVPEIALSIAAELVACRNLGRDDHENAGPV